MDPTTPTPPTVSSPFTLRRLAAMGLGFLFWPFFFFIFSGAPACMGFEEPTLSAIEGCPLAVEQLGTPVARSWMGMSCGNAETSDDFGNASWSFPVAGPRGSGSVDVVAEKRGGPWRLLSLQLDVNGRTIDVLSCSGGGPVSVTPTTLAATAESVIGSPGVAQGGACTIQLGPGNGPFPCRVQVSCGDRVIYGGENQGFSHCSSDPTHGLHVHDPAATPADGDPTMDLQLSAGTAVLTDEVSGGTWVVSLRFTPPAP